MGRLTRLLNAIGSVISSTKFTEKEVATIKANVTKLQTIVDSLKQAEPITFDDTSG